MASNSKSPLSKSHLTRTGHLVVTGGVALVGVLVAVIFDWRYLLPGSLLLLLLLYLLIKTNKPVSSSAYRTDTEQQEHQGIEQTRSSKTTDHPGKLSDIRLLLVSPGGSGSHTLRRQLSGWTVDFDTASSSVQAFYKLFTAARSNRPYQTVLINAPYLDMDDCQFATALRAEPALQSLYLIHYSGSILPARAEQLYSAGWSRVLNSPVDKTILFNALHSAQTTTSSEGNVVQLLDHYEVNTGQQPLDILISCRNSSECQRMRKMLTTAGHQVFVVNDHSQILDALENHHFDLAILEEEMGDISGMETIKVYRFAHLNERWVPFILLLENPTSTMIQACENGGIDHLLLKPVNAKRLFDSLIQALEENTHSQTLYPHPPNRGLKRFCDEELILDTHQLEQLRQLGKEPLFLLDLVNQFVDETEQLTEQLRKAMDRNNQKQTSNLGHQLKDAAGNLGALNLYRLAVRITQLTKNSVDQHPEQLIDEVETCRIATIRALHEYLSEGNNPAYGKD